MDIFDTYSKSQVDVIGVVEVCASVADLDPQPSDQRGFVSFDDGHLAASLSRCCSDFGPDEASSDDYN